MIKIPVRRSIRGICNYVKVFGVKENVTQDDIAEILPYCGDDAWYIGMMAESTDQVVKTA